MTSCYLILNIFSNHIIVSDIHIVKQTLKYELQNTLLKQLF